MKNIILIFIISILLTGCSKEPNTNKQLWKASRNNQFNLHIDSGILDNDLISPAVSFFWHSEKLIEPVGILTWSNGVLHFQGNADKSAKLFFDDVIKYSHNFSFSVLNTSTTAKMYGIPLSELSECMMPTKEGDKEIKLFVPSWSDLGKKLNSSKGKEIK